MGSSESKMASCSAVKPEPPVKKTHISHLIDPRSPSGGIDRTPIQVDGFVSRTSAKSECLPVFTDPRSPSVGIVRTPVREVMRATVDSLARRLSMIFHHEHETKSTEGPERAISELVEEEEEEVKGEERASTRPLLTPRLPRKFGSLDSPLQSGSDPSHFVLLDEPQVEVEIETEADIISLEEAEEARESPVHKRLSMSLIAYHEGATSSHIFAEVHREHASSPEPSEEVEGADHCYALPSPVVEPEHSAEPSLTTDVDSPPAQPEEEESLLSPEVEEASPPSEPLSVPSPEPPQVSTGIRCPTFDPRSPSQVVFKPQWLGKGFGATGARAKRVQGHRGKGGASPLAVRVAVKNVANENKGQAGKLKQKGNEGRSPLQILKDTNSPKEQHSQKKTKVSTPDKPRLGQAERRVLAVSLNKEN